MLEMLLPLVMFGAVFYFLLVRPQQRKAREHLEVLNSLQPGTRVVVHSGLYGTLTHVGDKQVIIEFAPGMEVTADKHAIRNAVAEDEEEFEFDDEAGAESTGEPTEVTESSEEHPTLDEAPEKN